MRNWRAWLGLLPGVLLLAAACVSGGNGNGGGGMATRHKKGPNEQVYIGFSMDTLKEERWQRDKELVEKHANEVGAKLDVLVANGSDTSQAQQADSMLTKGVDVLIRACALLRREGRAVRLVVAGGGDEPYVRSLQDLVRELGLNTSVQFAGCLLNVDGV